MAESCCNIIVVEESLAPTVVLEVLESSTVITAAEQGPPGRDATFTTLLTAGEALGGHRAVIIEGGEAVYASNLNEAHANRVIGLTRNAAALGADVEIVTYGLLDGFTGLTPDAKLYLQDNGTVSHAIPASGFLQQIGVAISDTKAILNIQLSIVRG